MIYKDKFLIRKIPFAKARGIFCLIFLRELILYIHQLIIYKNMALISVEVPDNIEVKYASYKVVSSFELYEELENEIWYSVKVWEKASVVLDYLKTIK